MNQQNKRFVWNYWKAMTNGGDQTDVVRYLHPDVLWHGFQPLRQLNDAQAIWSQFWQPLLTAIPDLQRRPFHFIGGDFEANAWACGTGDFIGTFANDWKINSITILASVPTFTFALANSAKSRMIRSPKSRLSSTCPI